MTTSDNLQSISTRIRALLAKAADAGVTEHEALAFAAKARELMERYQLGLSDLELREEGVATRGVSIFSLTVGKALAVNLALYCDCKVWGDYKAGQMKFFGLRSDTELAEWLYVALVSFVQQETLEWALAGGALKSEVEDFAIGCAMRISDRLREAAASRQPSGTGKALMVVKNALVTEEFAKLNLRLRYGGRTHQRASEAYGAGASAGERANFGRPLSGAKVAGLLS